MEALIATDFIKPNTKDKKSNFKLMGFGHRVYKSYDPRGKIIRKLADQVFEITGSNPLLEVALELEKIALEDDYFIERKLYPNVDFFSGLIYQALGFPASMFPILFDGLYRSHEIPGVVQGVEDAEDVDANFRGMGDKSAHQIVRVVAVAHEVLTAEQHLERSLGHEPFEYTDALPRVFC